MSEKNGRIRGQYAGEQNRAFHIQTPLRQPSIQSAINSIKAKNPQIPNCLKETGLKYAQAPLSQYSTKTSKKSHKTGNQNSNEFCDNIEIPLHQLTAARQCSAYIERNTNDKTKPETNTQFESSENPTYLKGLTPICEGYIMKCDTSKAFVLKPTNNDDEGYKSFLKVKSPHRFRVYKLKMKPSEGESKNHRLLCTQTSNDRTQTNLENPKYVFHGQEEPEPVSVHKTDCNQSKKTVKQDRSHQHNSSKFIGQLYLNDTSCKLANIYTKKTFNPTLNVQTRKTKEEVEKALYASCIEYLNKTENANIKGKYNITALNAENNYETENKNQSTDSKTHQNSDNTGNQQEMSKELMASTSSLKIKKRIFFITLILISTMIIYMIQMYGFDTIYRTIIQIFENLQKYPYKWVGRRLPKSLWAKFKMSIFGG